MKILFITRKFPPSVGGMELFAYELSEALNSKADLRLVKWAGRGRVRAVLIALPYLYLRAKWELLKGGVDVIHAQDGVLAPIAYVLSRLFRKPYTVQIHGLDITYRNPLFKAIVPPAVKKADLIFCISHDAARHLTKTGVDENKVKVINLAVSDVMHGKSDKNQLLAKLNLPADTPLILTVGRLVERKGVAWFIDKVLPALLQKQPKLIYLIAGEGGERSKIEDIIRKHNLNKHVRLLGRVDDETRLALYNGADVFVMPNINVPGDIEGFGLVLLEAALCARPIVAADTEGLKDAVVNGQNGLLVPMKDSVAFTKEINHFLADTDHSKKFADAARQFTLGNYRWDKVAERYIELYKTI